MSMTSTSAQQRRVPVEHRWLGLDRRSLPYAAISFAVLALWAWVLPWVSDQVAWDDPVRPGEAIQVTDDVTMAAAPGWGVVAGLRTSDVTRSGQKAVNQVVLVKDGVAFSVFQGPFSESPTRLLQQAELIQTASGEAYDFAVSGEVSPRTTASGLRGVTQDFSMADSRGAITAFVVDDVGIDIQVTGPEAQVAAHAHEVGDMIDSLAADGSQG